VNPGSEPTSLIASALLEEATAVIATPLLPKAVSSEPSDV
jgi:hypothetical protein